MPGRILEFHDDGTCTGRKAPRIEFMTAKAEAPIADAQWWRLVFDYGVRPNIPSAVKRFLRPLRRWRRQFGWLPTEFVERTALLSRIQAFAAPRGASPVQQAMHSYFYSGWNAHFHESWDRNAAFLGIEQRHPFFDRRLAEFAFALPERQRSHRGLVKIVLRNALQGRLPESVIRRRVQADFTPTFTAAVRALDGKTPFWAAQSWRGAGLLHASYLPLYRKLVPEIWMICGSCGLPLGSRFGAAGIREPFPAY